MRTGRRPGLASLCLLLASCGGGGGGDGGAGPAPGGGAGATPQPPAATPSPAPTATPLAISSGNVVDVGSAAMSFGEGSLQIAQLVADYARLARERATTSFAVSCRGGGTADVVLSDADQDRRPSPGDSLRVTLRGCYSPSLEGSATGEFVYALGTVAAGATEAYRGTATFTGGFAIVDRETAGRAEVAGALGVAWRSDAASNELRISPGPADDFVVTGIDGATRSVERIRSPALARTSDFASGRSTVDMSYTLDSELLRGRIVVSSPTPFSALFNTFPDRGTVQVRGDANSLLEVLPEGGSGPGRDALIRLASPATGAPSPAFSEPWGDFTEGFLWWEPGGWSDVDSRGYETLPRPTTAGFGFRYLAPRGSIPVGAELVLQFSEALSSTEVFAFSLVGALGAERDVVPTTVRTLGSRILVRPARQLLHGVTYTLQKTAGRFVPQSTGPEFNGVLSFVTRNNLVAAATATRSFASPGISLVLDGSGSTSLDGPVQRYAWRQLSGTVAALSAASGPQVTVVAPRGAAAIETLRFELSVENAAGEVDSAQVAIELVNDPASTTLFLVRGSVGSIPFGGQTRLLTSANGQFNQTRVGQGFFLFHTSPAGVSFGLRAAGADGAALAVGTYENAQASPPAFGQPVPPLLEVSAENTACSTATGRFEVFEIQYDASGVVTRLALDFTQRCVRGDSTQAPPLAGSIRLNSTRPLAE